MEPYKKRRKLDPLEKELTRSVSQEWVNESQQVIFFHDSDENIQANIQRVRAGEGDCIQGKVVTDENGNIIKASPDALWKFSSSEHLFPIGLHLNQELSAVAKEGAELRTVPEDEAVNQDDQSNETDEEMKKSYVQSSKDDAKQDAKPAAKPAAKVTKEQPRAATTSQEMTTDDKREFEAQCREHYLDSGIFGFPDCLDAYIASLKKTWPQFTLKTNACFEYYDPIDHDGKKMSYYEGLLQRQKDYEKCPPTRLFNGVSEKERLRRWPHLVSKTKLVHENVVAGLTTTSASTGLTGSTGATPATPATTKLFKDADGANGSSMPALKRMSSVVPDGSSEETKQYEAKREADERKITVAELFQWLTIPIARYREIKTLLSIPSGGDLKTRPYIVKHVKQRVYVWFSNAEVLTDDENNNILLTEIKWTSRYFYINSDGYLEAITCEAESSTVHEFCNLVTQEQNRWAEENMRLMLTAMKQTDTVSKKNVLSKVKEGELEKYENLLKIYVERGFEDWTAEKQRSKSVLSDVQQNKPPTVNDDDNESQYVDASYYDAPKDGSSSTTTTNAKVDLSGKPAPQAVHSAKPAAKQDAKPADSCKKQMENHKYFLLKWSGSQGGGFVLNPHWNHKTKEELLQTEGVGAFTFVECDRRPKTWVVIFNTKEEAIAFISKRAEIIEQRLKGLYENLMSPDEYEKKLTDILPHVKEQNEKVRERNRKLRPLFKKKEYNDATYEERKKMREEAAGPEPDNSEVKKMMEELRTAVNAINKVCRENRNTYPLWFNPKKSVYNQCNARMKCVDSSTYRRRWDTLVKLSTEEGKQTYKQEEEKRNASLTKLERLKQRTDGLGFLARNAGGISLIHVSPPKLNL